MLGDAARQAFDEVASGDGLVIVPAISLAELVMMSEKGRSAIDATLITVAIRAAPGFELRPLTPEVALSIRALTALPDIHDRLIVAEALANNATLITRDQLIVASGLVPTLW